jgi:glutathione S-transferase
MITLYHAPKSRSTRIIWLLEELDTPYRIETVSIRRSPPGQPTQGQADPDNIHPHGKVPAIEHEGVVVFESAAIALYLTDAFPQNGIGPVVGNTLRGAYLTWLAYYTGEMEPTFISSLLGLTANTAAVPWAPKDAVMAHVNRTLENGPTCLARSFFDADILVCSAFTLFLGSPALPRTDLLATYVDRVTARPAYNRSEEIDGTPGYNFSANKIFA